jgi:hypothetical protein
MNASLVLMKASQPQVRVKSAPSLTLKKRPQARQSKGLRVCKSALMKMR